MIGLALSPCNASLHRSGSAPVNLLAELNWTVGVVSGAGEYFEIDDNFSISEEA